MRPCAFAGVRSLAIGLFHDGWATRVLRYRVWPGDSAAGTYRVRLELPAEHSARAVTLSLEGRVREVVRLRPGDSELVEIPARGRPVPRLYIATDGADFAGGGDAADALHLRPDRAARVRAGDGRAAR